MQVLKWKIKRLFKIFLILLFIYVCIIPRKFNYKDEVRISKIHPSVVWEYVTDFSNMIHLNPTMKDLSILSESGNIEHWKYTAQYTEKLSHWPYLTNVAIADFSIKSNWKKNLYTINSTHTTCFFKGWFCVQSDSEFNFILVNNIYVGAKPDTLCQESVNYGCPSIFYLFCRREVRYQRRKILNNLKKHFMENY